MNRRHVVLSGLMLLAIAPGAHGGLIVYEGFDYSTGALRGQNGGAGDWTTPWEAGTSGFGNNLAWQVASPGLSYNDGSLSLITTGNALRDNDQFEQRDQRAYDTTGLFADGSVVWTSFLIQLNSQNSDVRVLPFSAGSLTSGLGWFMFNGSLRLRRIDGSFVDSEAVNIADGQTHLVLGRFEFAAGEDQYTYWVDPQLGAEPDVADGITLLTSAAPLAAWDKWYIRSGDGAAAQDVWLDEFRIGTDFSSVAPHSSIASPVPEPSSLALLGMGLLGVAGCVRRRQPAGAHGL